MKVKLIVVLNVGCNNGIFTIKRNLILQDLMREKQPMLFLDNIMVQL